MRALSLLPALLTFALLPLHADEATPSPSPTPEPPFPAAVVASEALVVKEVPSAELPAKLRAQIEQDETFAVEGGKLPAKLGLLTQDLNGDGKPEFLLREPTSYTGGPMFFLFSSEDTGCELIGQIQGDFFLAAPENGYAQIVTVARAGGADYERSLWVFKDGLYEETRTQPFTLDANGKEIPAKPEADAAPDAATADAPTPSPAP